MPWYTPRVPTFAATDLTDWFTMLSQLRPAVSASRSLEEASRETANALRRSYPDSVALARVYALLPFGVLDDARKAAAVGAAKEPLHDDVRVLTLLGTNGDDPSWCDVKLSKGHRAVPLVSSASANGIPMVAQLLRELGVGLAWLDAPPRPGARRTLGGDGVFFVEHAATALDAEGRRIIPADEFVRLHHIRSVFGFGVVLSNVILAIIVFSHEHLMRTDVERLVSLPGLLRTEALELVAGDQLLDSP